VLAPYRQAARRPAPPPPPPAWASTKNEGDEEEPQAFWLSDAALVDLRDDRDDLGRILLGVVLVASALGTGVSVLLAFG
jgi:hypothetical protein